MDNSDLVNILFSWLHVRVNGGPIVKSADGLQTNNLKIAVTIIMLIYYMHMKMNIKWKLVL